MYGSLEFWRTVNIVVAAVGQTAFVVLYVTFPWWRTFLGKALFFKASAFALLVDVAVVGRIWDWPHEEATFVALYGLLGVGIWAQFVAFLRVRLTDTQDEVSGNAAREGSMR